MNVRGSETLDAPRAAVFAAICDPDTLLGVIPGCREIEQVGDAEYRGRISLRLPGVVGTYRTVVRLVDADAAALRPARGRGRRARSARSRVRPSFRLAEADGRTTIDYDGQAVIGGPLARLDTRFVEGLAGSLISQGLGNLDSRLQGDPSADVASDGRPRDAGRLQRDGQAATSCPIAAGGARPARAARPGAAGDGRRHGRHAAHQRGDLAARGGDGPAPGRPRPDRARRTATLRIGATATLTQLLRPGRRPDAPRGGPQHRQLVDPQHGHRRRQPVHAAAGRRRRGRPAGPRRARDPGQHAGASASSRWPTSTPAS